MTPLRRFLEHALSDWLRDQARRCGYAADPDRRRRALARRLVTAAVAEQRPQHARHHGANPLRPRRSGKVR